MPQKKLYVIDYCEGREPAGYISTEQPAPDYPPKVILEFTVVTKSHHDLRNVVSILTKQTVDLSWGDNLKIEGFFIHKPYYYIEVELWVTTK